MEVIVPVEEKSDAAHEVVPCKAKTFIPLTRRISNIDRRRYHRWPPLTARRSPPTSELARNLGQGCGGCG
ncbi:hypothetical protein CRG98_036327 [Punica granatum]|uniref:Uncharacterized protein n=1 Tax=Punica granatum TaxID=22663 RepID=A0A2I0IGW3_PUNGR|nr:hypothetical protein CRG98_036327 [Punica granatum]